MTTTLQVVGSGLIKFDFFVQRLGSREAARDLFEQLVEDIVSLVHPDVHSVKANPGDWGIDAFVGELTRGGDVFVWQAKYLIDGFGKTQQADVRESYASAKKAAAAHGYTIRGWTLCLPTTLDAPNMRWWQGWVKRTSSDGIAKILWDEGELRRKLLSDAATDIRNAYFAPVVVLPNETSADATRRALEELKDGSTYEDTLFVRQMHAAHMAETLEAREAFFNAEILAQEVADKGVPEELQLLQDWRIRVGSTWSVHYNDSTQRIAGDQLPGLFRAVMDDIEQRHVLEARGLRASPVHGFGIMHQAVEKSRAGWTRGWRKVAAEHIAGPEKRPLKAVTATELVNSADTDGPSTKTMPDADSASASSAEVEA